MHSLDRIDTVGDSTGWGTRGACIVVVSVLQLRDMDSTLRPLSSVIITVISFILLGLDSCEIWSTLTVFRFHFTFHSSSLNMFHYTLSPYYDAVSSSLLVGLLGSSTTYCWSNAQILVSL